MSLTKHPRRLRRLFLALTATALAGSAFAQSNSVVFSGQTFTNKGLVGVGRMPSNLKDKFGETFGSFSAFTFDPASLQFSNGSITGTLYAQPDRGYNAVGTTNYIARYNIIQVAFTPSATGGTAQNQVKLTLADTIQYKEADGTPFTSLDPLTNGSATRAGFPNLPAGANGRITLDPEGIVRLPDGTLYVSDEYGPYIYRFAANGTLLSAIRPPEAFIGKRNGQDSFSSNNPGPGASAPTPADPVTGRQNNQGLEGLTLAPNGRTLFALLQSAARQDGGTGGTSAVRFNTRLLAYDIAGANPALKGEYVFQLPTYLQGTATRVAAQSEALALNDTQFLVITRDSGNGRGLVPTSVYRTVSLYDITGATNIAGTAFDTPTTPIAPGGELVSSIKPATRTELININDPVQLSKFGLHNGPVDDMNNLAEKWEGLSLVPALDPAAPDDVYLFVGNDNDFLTTDGFQVGGAYNAGVDNDSMILVYRLTLPTYVDPMALRSAAVTGAPLIQALGNHTIGLARLASRDIGGHLAALRLGETRRAGWSVFANGNWADLDEDGRGNYPGHTADGWAATGGAEYAFNDLVTVGAALSKVKGDVRVRGAWAFADTDGVGFNAYVTLNPGPIFAEFNIGQTEFDHDVGRVTGAYGLSATGSTSSTVRNFGGLVGWRGDFGGFQVETDIGIDRYDVDVDSFAETGAMNLNLLYPALKPLSTQGHLGLQVSRKLPLGSWSLTPYLAAEYRYEFESDPDAIDLTVANRTAVAGATTTVFTSGNDSSAIEGRLGVSATISQRLRVNLEGLKLFSDDQRDHQSVQLSANFAF